MRTAIALLLISFGLVFLLFLKINSDNLIKDYKYIGSDRCKACHSVNFRGDQYGIWKRSSHAHAVQTLTDEKALDYSVKNKIIEPLKNPDCLKCHSTGYKMELKYFETSFNLSEGIQCEACHKPGSEYSKYQNMISIEKFKSNGGEKGNIKDCYQCHAANIKDNKTVKCPFQIKNFNAAEAFKLIKHSVPK